MARAIWTGSIGFGLVNIPVRLFNATSPKDVRFHQFDRETGRRVRYRRVVPDTGELARPMPALEEPPAREAPKGPTRQGVFMPAERPMGPGTGPPEREVAFEEIVKGFEIDPDRYVTVDPEELRALAPTRSDVIEIEDFVDLREIDPVYFEKSYYVAPRRTAGAEKPYALLLRAMDRAGKVGVARFVLRTKEYLAAIRPMSGILVLETMFFADEVRDFHEADFPPGEVPVSERELAMAEQLIGMLATDWDPKRYEDTYRTRVLDLIKAKAGADEVIQAEETEPAPRVPDLMAALRASVEAAKTKVDGPVKDGKAKRTRSRKAGARRSVERSRRDSQAG
jgi:DNA end-binding protein Ku